jgi:hypothetical protein
MLGKRDARELSAQRGRMILPFGGYAPRLVKNSESSIPNFVNGWMYWRTRKREPGICRPVVNAATLITSPSVNAASWAHQR